MKKLLLLSILAIYVLPLQAQTQQRDQALLHKKRATHARFCPRAYIGLSTGVNNPVGLLGVQVDIAASPSVTIGSGVGISSWGYKTFLEGRYYFGLCSRGWAIGGGFTYNTGLTDFQLTDQETVVGKADVVINEKSQANFMISGYRFFSLGRSGRNRFHIQAGFSVPLTEKEFTQVSGPAITQDTYDNIRATAPGGLILAAGFSFGLGEQR